MIAQAVSNPGFRGLCAREVQKSLKQSAKHLLESKIAGHKLSHLFDCQNDIIKTPGGGVIDFIGLQDHTAESIKSYEGFDVAWIEEGQSVPLRSLNMLRPTIRAAGSEIWASWNPRRKTDPIDAMFRGEEKPSNALIVNANWSDNPWLPEELNQERLDCLRQQPDQYDHIWMGGYITVSDGAYFARQLAECRSSGRIASLTQDPLMGLRAYWDIGVADATSIWVCQFVGHQIKVIDYYEAVRQDLATHLAWLRDNGYAKAECILPHDGAKADAITAIRFEDHIRAAGFKVRTIPNQGRGAAMKRVETARRLFPSIWFDGGKCQAGLDALGWYHEKKDETRGIGLGPEHDWSSHGADAFGLMCCDFEAPKAERPMDLSRLMKGIV